MPEKDTQAKLFFSMSEACAQAGISPYTLRYWEKRIGLSFLRTPHGKRMFRPEDIQRLRRISSLLREGYALRHVSQRMREQVQMELPLPSSTNDTRRFLRKIREELQVILEEIS